MESNSSELRLDVEHIWFSFVTFRAIHFSGILQMCGGHNSYYLINGNDAILVPRQFEKAELFDSDTEVA